jgi:hypothetical protein
MVTVHRLLLVVALVLVAGCGGDENGATPTAMATPTRTLSVVHNDTPVPICFDIDGTPCPTATPTPQPGTPTPSCARTALIPSCCAAHCEPCPTIRAGCNAQSCQDCIEQPVCAPIPTCGALRIATPTPISN